MVEGDLKFDFSSALHVQRFDDPKVHGASAMKAMDFLVEFQDRLVFIEVKDPENTQIVPSLRSHKRNEMKTNMSDDAYLHELGQKFRDSYLYLALEGKKPTKPVVYVVLVGLQSVSFRTLDIMTRLLKNSTCFDGPHGKGWVEPYLTRVAAVGLNQWNRVVPEVTVQRVGRV